MLFSFCIIKKTKLLDVSVFCSTGYAGDTLRYSTTTIAAISHHSAHPHPHPLPTSEGEELNLIRETVVPSSATSHHPPPSDPTPTPT
jgi:hypothetical protein